MGQRAKYKRYERPEEPPPVSITSGDREIFLALRRYGVLDSKAIYKLFPARSQRGVSNRLKLLFRAGYLHRLNQLQSIYLEGGGSRHEAYVLDRLGMDWLWEEKQLLVSERLHHLKERSASYLLHDIEAAHLVISLRASIALRSDVEFLFPEDYYQRFAPKWLERNDIPVSVRASIDWHKYHLVEGTIPDFRFVLYYPGNEEGRQFRSFVLEYCRGTETIEPSASTIRSMAFWKQSSLLRKFVVYAHAIKNDTYRKDFGMPLSHVLTVTTTPQKVARMQLAYRNHLSKHPHKLNPNRLLFADMKTIGKYEDVLAAPIHSADNQTFELL